MHKKSKKRFSKSKILTIFQHYKIEDKLECFHEMVYAIYPSGDQGGVWDEECVVCTKCGLEVDYYTTYSTEYKLYGDFFTGYNIWKSL